MNRLYREIRLPELVRRAGARVGIVLVIAATHPAPGHACTGAALTTNPATGRQEKVWQEHDGQDYEIKYAENVSGSWCNQAQLTFDSIDETCPALGFDSGGATALVWKAATSPSQVLYVARKLVSGNWVWQSGPVTISDGTRDASAPFVTFDGNGRPWVVWRETGPGSTVRVVAGGGQGSDPWPTVFDRYLIATFSDPGSTFLDLASENGKLWATWVSNSVTLQYSVWNGTDAWSPPSDVAIVNGNVAAAKAAARSVILQ